MPTPLAIADDTDLIVTVDRDDLLTALSIVETQLDGVDDDEAGHYGLENAAAARSFRDRLLAVVNAVNEAV